MHKARLIIFAKCIEMPGRFPEKFATFCKWPVRRSIFVIVFTDFIKHFPVLQDFTVSPDNGNAAIIDVIGFGSAAIEFKYGIIDPPFQIFHRSAFYVVSAIIKFIGVMA